MDKALDAAERLAKALHAKHYSEVTQWRPLTGDLVGLITQIDNMTSGLSRAATPATDTSGLVERLRALSDELWWRPVAMEAADCIEALERERAAKDARLAEAEAAFEVIRNILINELVEPGRSAFWAAVNARDAARSYLEGRK
jgi:hypothetical protein